MFKDAAELARVPDHQRTSWDLWRDPLHKIIVDRIIDHPITSLMLAFAAEAVGGPGDDKSMCGIAEADGTL